MKKEQSFDLNGIIPLRNNIIAKVTLKNESGLVLPESAKENAEHVFVAVKCGADVTNVKEGDVLLINVIEYASTRVSIAEDYYLIPETVVLAVKR